MRGERSQARTNQQTCLPPRFALALLSLWEKSIDGVSSAWESLRFSYEKVKTDETLGVMAPLMAGTRKIHEERGSLEARRLVDWAYLA